MKSMSHVFAGVAIAFMLAAGLVTPGATPPQAQVETHPVTVNPAAAFDLSRPLAAMIGGGRRGRKQRPGPPEH